jgi:N4-gp56 family major capsid protein
MAWQYDAPNGVYKNHTISDKIRKQALAKAVFFKFLTPEQGFGRKKGESITITRILRLPLANRVGETDRLPGGRPAIETKTVKISEWGYKVPMTTWETDLTFFDLPNQIESVLRDQIELTMDVMAADVFKLTPIKYTPTSAGFNLQTNGVPSGTSDRNISVSDLRAIHDYLAGDLKAPTFANGKYVGILSTQAARGLKNDPEYKDWLAPSTSQPLMDGVLKDIEGFTLIETNNFGYERNALAKFAGSSTTTGEAVFFGADAAGLLEIQSPEIRMGVKEDLGRFYEVGWVGKLESFLTWEKASIARVVHVTSN